MMRQREDSRGSRRGRRQAAVAGFRHRLGAQAAKGDPDRPATPIPISVVLDKLRDAAAAHDEEVAELAL